MIEIVAAAGIAVLLLAVFGIARRRVRGTTARKVLMLAAAVVLFLVVLLANVANADSWLPLVGFVQLGATLPGFGDVLFHVCVFACYAAAGFALGCGFVQYTAEVVRGVKESDRGLSGKRLTENFYAGLDTYVDVVICIGLASVLLDTFGVFHGVPVVRTVLELATVSPLLWMVIGLGLFHVKYWRNKKISLDFSLQVNRNALAPDKIFVHRIFLAMFFWFALFMFLLMYFLVPAYPGMTVFSILAFVGVLARPSP